MGVWKFSRFFAKCWKIFCVTGCISLRCNHRSKQNRFIPNFASFKVQPNSPANSGLIRGDIITKVGDYDARDLRHEDAQMLFRTQDNKIRLVVRRDNRVAMNSGKSNPISSLPPPPFTPQYRPIYDPEPYALSNRWDKRVRKALTNLINEFSFVERHRHCREATKMFTRLQLNHFPIRHSRMGSRSQHTIRINNNKTISHNKAISSKIISPSNRLHQNQRNTSTTRRRHLLELASAHNWLATTSNRSMMKTRPFRIRWEFFANNCHLVNKLHVTCIPSWLMHPSDLASLRIFLDPITSRTFPTRNRDNLFYNFINSQMKRC